MHTHYAKVREFMLKAKQDVPPHPYIPDEKTRELRAALIIEEALETVSALGVTVSLGGEPINDAHLDFEANRTANLEYIADGCADVTVVITGTALACGIDMSKIQDLVDDNNLAKFGPGHSFREDGKLIKPPGHTPPDIRAELDRQALSKDRRGCPDCGSLDFEKERTETGAQTGDNVCNKCGNTWWRGI